MQNPRGLSVLFPAYQTLTAIAFVLSVIHIPAHWRSGNVATVSLGLWNAGGNLLAFINTLVWRGNLRNPYPIWGDITAFYWANMGVAIASCALAIIHRLYHISRLRKILVTRAEKRRQLCLTYFLCWGVPLIQGAIRIVMQGPRYNLFEDVGPFPVICFTPLTFVVYLICEPIICLISTIYCGLNIWWYLKQRKAIDAMLGGPSVRLTKNEYLRLLSLSAVCISIYIPISTVTTTVSAAFWPISPWTSWDDLSSNFGQISYINRLIIDTSPHSRVLVIVSFSMVPTAGILYFLFFGFGEEAFRQYKAASMWLFWPLYLLGLKLPRVVRASGAGSGSVAKVIAGKPMRHFGVSPSPHQDPPLTMPVTHTPSSQNRQTSPLSSRLASVVTCYLSDMFSSFGTSYSYDIRTTRGIQPQMSQAPHHEPQSRHQLTPFNLNLDEMPPESAHHALPSSGVPTRRNSDDFEAIQEDQEEMNTVNYHHALSDSITSPSSSSSPDPPNKDEKVEPLFLPMGSDKTGAMRTCPHSNGNRDQVRDLESGGSRPNTDALAMDESVKARFTKDSELTEEVTF